MFHVREFVQVCGVKGSCGQANNTHAYMIAGIAPVIECREQSAETERGGGSTAGQEGSSAPRTFKVGRGTYSAQSTTDGSTWVLPPTSC